MSEKETGYNLNIEMKQAKGAERVWSNKGYWPMPTK
jgi:hypothetical protein